MDPVGARRQRLRIVGDRGGNGVARDRPTMIGLEQRDHVARSGMGPGEPDGEIVRLGSAVDEKDSVEPFRRKRRKALRKLRHGSIVEPRIGVEQRPLPPDRSRQARMPVADGVTLLTISR